MSGSIRDSIFYLPCNVSLITIFLNRYLSLINTLLNQWFFVLIFKVQTTYILDRSYYMIHQYLEPKTHSGLILIFLFSSNEYIDMNIVYHMIRTFMKSILIYFLFFSSIFIYLSNQIHLLYLGYSNHQFCHHDHCGNIRFFVLNLSNVLSLIIVFFCCLDDFVLDFCTLLIQWKPTY